MKNSILISIFTFLFCFVSSAQTGWNWLNPKPQGNTLVGVQMISPSLAYAVGKAGTIIRTSNGGAEWKTLRSRTNLNINGLSFVHPDSGFVVGDSGLILKTFNAGQAWFRQNSGTSKSLKGTFFLNPKVGWAVGDKGTLLKTSNGGASWIAQNSQTTRRLTTVQFKNLQVGWAVGDSGIILKTTNGGNNWALQASTAAHQLNDFQFIDLDTGFAVGDSGTILKTVNGGSLWTQFVPVTDLDLNSITILDSDSLLIPGGNSSQNPFIIKTVDGGANWDVTTFAPEFSVFDLSMITSNVGIGVGVHGYIIKTLDKLESATNQKTGFPEDFGSVFFLSPDSGFVMGNNNSITVVYKTVNGGNSWALTNLPNPPSIPTDIAFVTPSVGFLCGTSGKVFKTIDRGDNWAPLTSTSSSTNWALSFVHPDTGTVVGTNSTIFRTTNGGLNWVQQTSGTAGRWFDVQFANSHIGYIAGEDGIQKTTNDGANWNSQYTGDTLFSLVLTGAQSAFAVGQHGLILKTVNGGTNWTPVSSGTKAHLQKIHFANSQIGLVTGDSGVILRTDDGGNTWIRQLSYSSQLHYSCFQVNDTAGYVVGARGTILKTTTGGNTCPDALFNYTGVFLPGKFCEDDTLTQSLYFDGTPGGTFSATPPGINIDPTSGIIKPWLSTPGSYTVQYQVTPPNGCPTQTFQTTALVQDKLFIPRARLEVKRPEYALPPQTVYAPCQGDTLLTSARNQFANLGFAWYRNNNLLHDTTQEIKVSQSGLYSVKYRDQACAGPFYDTVQIDFEDAKRPRKPDLQLTSPPVSCNDDFTLTTSTGSAISFEWVDEFGAVLPGQTGNTLNQNRVGTFRIQIDSMGCKNISEPITILPVGADTILPTLYSVTTKGVDVPTEKNEVRWNRQNYDTTEVKRVVVYRAAETDVFYSPIAEIPATDSLFTDPSAVPGGQAFSYKISAKQLCGTELFFTPSSDLQNSIHLDISNHPPNHYILRWSEPMGYIVQKYRILRGLSYDNLSILVDSLAGTTTSYMDDLPTANAYFYRIEAETNQAYSPWGRIAAAVRKTTSNTRNTILSFCDSCNSINVLAEIEVRKLRVFPNPSEGQITLSGFTPGEMVNLQLVSSLGKVVLRQSLMAQGKTMPLHFEDKGLFYLVIHTATGRYTMRLVFD